jgi:hypothetical protein
VTVASAVTPPSALCGDDDADLIDLARASTGTQPPQSVVTSTPMSAEKKRLLRAIRHVNYELERLAQLPSAQEYARDVLQNETLAGAAFEAALLHLRNLSEFFVDKHRTKRIRAAQFSDAWDPDDSGALTALRRRMSLISAHVVHLGWRRVDFVQETDDAYADWPTRRLTRDMINVFGEFVNTITDADFATGFQEGLDVAVTALELPPPVHWTLRP